MKPGKYQKVVNREQAYQIMHSNNARVAARTRHAIAAKAPRARCESMDNPTPCWHIPNPARRAALHRSGQM
jgi:hypothetical protein